MIRPSDLRTKAIAPTREAVASYLSHGQSKRKKSLSPMTMIMFLVIIVIVARTLIDATAPARGPLDEPSKPGYIFSPQHRLSIRAVIPKEPQAKPEMIFETAIIIRWETKEENHIHAGHSVYVNWQEAEKAATRAVERYSRSELLRLSQSGMDALLEEIRITTNEWLFPDHEIAVISRIQFSGAGRFRGATPEEVEDHFAARKQYNVSSASFSKTR